MNYYNPVPDKFTKDWVDGFERAYILCRDYIKANSNDHQLADEMKEYFDGIKPRGSFR